MNKLKKHIGLVLLLVGLGSCGDPELPQEVAQAMSNVPDQLDYNFHVKPILSDRCFACHGPDKNKQKGDLRLDLPVAYDKVTESGRKALVPGNLADSEVFHRIISTDPELMMPTPESHLVLTPEEKAILIAWIKEGAEYKPHWSLVAPAKPELPPIKTKGWANNPIDHFVLAKLEEKGLKPNKEAPKETLLRRLSFDLTGLPPTVAEIDAFVADTSPNAYEKVVDRLLRSPHYGERMAVDWLDLARYADTHGYQDDGMRNAYPWRDWVISAFNKNLPYDKFITWQLAGDLLPNATKEQLIATCFLRNHPQSQEGGIIDEEYRVEYVADRVNTFGKAFLAFSTECARCHDHKYDPITQKNYFQLFSFFNNNNETGQAPDAGEASPSLILTTAEAAETIRFLKGKMAPLEQQQQDLEVYRPAFQKWLSRATKDPKHDALPSQGLIGRVSFDEELPVHFNPRPGRAPKESQAEKIPAGSSRVAAKLFSLVEGKLPQQVPGKYGQGLRVDGDMGVSFNDQLDFDRHQPFTISVWVKPFKADVSGPLFGKAGGDLNGWRGYLCELNKDQTLSIKLTHVYPDNGIELKTKQKLKPQQWQHLVLAYDGSSRAKGVRFYIDGQETPVQILNDHLRQSLLHAKDKSNNRSVQTFMLGREVRASVEHIGFDEFRGYGRQLSAVEVRQLAGEKDLLRKLLETPAPQRTPEQTSLLFNYYLLAVDPNFARLQKQLTELRGQENDLLTDQEEVMVYKELVTPRPTYLLDRGVYDAPTEQVFPNTPESMLPFEEQLPKNRLGLAQWLLLDKHPLFARVTVNRLWQQVFGQGLVKTADDFGNQGELPTHPELLDWLSVTFRESGWNVKRLLKTIVLSAAYRQGSVPTASNKTEDPENRLYSRAPAYRMSAEMIRDNALAASGLLVRKVGGPSVNPYQPPGVWEALAVRLDVGYIQGQGDDLYRRSMYTVWKRSSPHPAMTNFDVPDRFACSVKRQKTSTPLQALVLMNDVQYVEAARVLGEKMVREGGATPKERITFAFRRLTSRYPRPQELAILTNLYQQEEADFRKNPTRAKQLLQEGEFQRDASLPPHEAAACTVLASTLMNFDEFIIKR